MTALILAVTLAQRPVVAAHYMPWFESKADSLGWHWTMGNPKAGKEKLASHYTPLLGAYDSNDPDALEAHVLWMKLSGIEGVIVDWYGIEDVLDYGNIHRNTLHLIKWLRRAKLRFAICYEDQTLPQIIKAGKATTETAVAHSRKVVDWMAKEWFADPLYIRIDGKPLLLVFGPQYFKEGQWPEIIGGQPVSAFGVSGPHRFGNGGFAWPSPTGGDEKSDADLAAFYERAKPTKPFLAAAYPRFHDYYQEAGLHPTYGRISDQEGNRYRKTLDQAYASGSPLIQLVTWNDWGEGTQIEPSKEFGYRDLEATQAFIRSSVDSRRRLSAADLKLPLRLYKLRKEGKAAEADLLSRRLFAR